MWNWTAGYSQRLYVAGCSKIWGRAKNPVAVGDYVELDEDVEGVVVCKVSTSPQLPRPHRLVP